MEEKAERPNRSSLEPLGAAGMGTSAGAALHIHGVCWEPRGSHIQLSTAVTAAVGYLCLAIRCFLPQNIWEEQRPSYKEQAIKSKDHRSSDETLFANLCIYRFFGFEDSGHLAAGKVTASRAGEHLSSPLPQPTTFATEGLHLFQGLLL